LTTDNIFLPSICAFYTLVRYCITHIFKIQRLFLLPKVSRNEPLNHESEDAHGQGRQPFFVSRNSNLQRVMCITRLVTLPTEPENSGHLTTAILEAMENACLMSKDGGLELSPRLMLSYLEILRSLIEQREEALRALPGGNAIRKAS
jgi:hypothetical protein